MTIGHNYKMSSREQCSTGAHEAYLKYDESLGRRNSTRSHPDGSAKGRQGSTRTRSTRPHSMHERASSLKTNKGEKVQTPLASKRWIPHVDMPPSESPVKGLSMHSSPEPQIPNAISADVLVAPSPVALLMAPPTPTPTPHSLAPTPHSLAPTPHSLAPTPHSLAPSPQPLAPSPQPLSPSPQPLAPSPQPAAYSAAPSLAPSPNPSTPEAIIKTPNGPQFPCELSKSPTPPTAYAATPISVSPRTPTPASFKAPTPPNGSGALVPVSPSPTPGVPMTLHLTVPKDLTDAITDLRETVVENTDLLSQLIAKQPGANGVEEPKKKPISLNEPIKKPFKVMVECKVIFLKIGEIETLKEQYNAEVYVQAKWREPELDGIPADKLIETDYTYYWNPNLYVENAQSQTKEKVWSTAVLDEIGECYIIERRRMKGVFAETLELNDFPFDCQDLTVTITTERSEKELELVPDLKEDSAVNLTQFVEQQEWTIHQYIETNIALRFNEYSYSKQKHPVFAVTSRASRKPGYFYWNIFLVMFFISTLSFATFSVKPELPQNRLQLTFTLLLTKVAFKFTVSQSLPRISYLTYLDKYILATMIMLYMVCIWYATVTIIMGVDFDLAVEVDTYAFYAMVLIYVGFHLIFALWLYFDACQGRRSMFTKDKEMQRKIAETNKKQQDDMRDGT